MQLHQLLRLIRYNTPIIIFDIQGIEMAKVDCKSKLNVDLYEEEVFNVYLHISVWSKEPYMAIVLQK